MALNSSIAFCKSIILASCLSICILKCSLSSSSSSSQILDHIYENLPSQKDDKVWTLIHQPPWQPETLYPIITSKNLCEYLKLTTNTKSTFIPCCYSKHYLFFPQPLSYPSIAIFRGTLCLIFQHQILESKSAQKPIFKPSQKNKVKLIHFFLFQTIQISIQTN